MKKKRQENSNRKDCPEKDIREILPIVKKKCWLPFHERRGNQSHSFYCIKRAWRYVTFQFWTEMFNLQGFWNGKIKAVLSFMLFVMRGVFYSQWEWTEEFWGEEIGWLVLPQKPLCSANPQVQISLAFAGVSQFALGTWKLIDDIRDKVIGEGVAFVLKRGINAMWGSEGICVHQLRKHG